MGHFGPLEGVVVHEGQRVGGEVERPADLGDRLGLGIPADLGVDEQIGESEGGEPLHGRLLVVPAGDRVQDATPVEEPDQLDDPREGPDVGRVPGFQEYAVPERVVEVPDHALDPGAAGGCVVGEGISHGFIAVR